MKKLGLLSVVLVLFVAGCGKKKSSHESEVSISKPKTSGKLVSSADFGADIPEYREETERLFDDEAVADFAFVDDENQENMVASADLTNDIGALIDDEDIAVASMNDVMDLQDLGLDEDKVFKTVHFDFNKNDIKPDQRGIVEEDVQIARIAANSGKQIVVQGHCCQIGSESYNMALSQRRAEAIKNEMVRSGVPASRIKTVGYGNEMPIAWSDKTDRAGLVKDLAPNRRAEIIIN